MVDRKWPELTIEGGVHGKDTVVRINGERVERVTRAEVVFDVNDAVRLTTHQLVRAAVSVEVAPGAHTKVFTAIVMREWTEEDKGVDPSTGKPWQNRRIEEIVRATANTDWEALADCARQLELAAHAEGQEVAQAGTIMEPSGRPPGQ